MSERAPEPTPTQPVTRKILVDFLLPETKNTAHVEIREIKMLPNQKAGLHLHNGPVVGNIVEGSVAFQVEGQPEIVLRPGDVFFEPANIPIAKFDAQEQGVTFIAYFLLEAGQQPTLQMLAN